MFKEFPDLLSVKDLQKALNVGRNVAYGLIRDGSIKHLRIWRSIKIPKPYLMDFMRESCYTDGVTMANQACED